MRIPPLLLLFLTASVVPACGDVDPGAAPGETDGPERSDLVRSGEREGSSNGRENRDPDARVVFLGTSLTEGYGLAAPEEDAWPARIGRLADSAGLFLEIVNAGLSGETSAGALRRLDWVLRQEPDVLIVETGGNDGLRALPVEALEENLDGIVARVEETHPETRIVLLGMEAPPNLGSDYAGAFRAAYERVADRREVAFVPFFLEGVAGLPELNQSDGIHPTAEGHRMMAENAWPTLESVLREVAGP